MPFCNPDKITVSPDRFRPADPVEVDAMAASIKELGQLQPIVISNSFDLMWGLHRLEACKKLKREIWYETEELARLSLGNPMLLRVAEFQENFRRKDFTPIEKNKAVAEIHKLMRIIYGNSWTQEDTAKKLGFKSHRTVNDAILINKASEVGVPGVEKAKTTTEQLSIIKKFKQSEARTIATERRVAQGNSGEIENPLDFFGGRIILGDALTNIKKLGNSICSLFITDPPWKIGMDEAVEDHGSGVQKAVGSYDDSSETIIQLVKDVITEMHRVAKPDAYAVVFCGAVFWNELAEHSRKVGFQVYNKPLVWLKTGSNNGFCSSKSPAPTMWPASVTDFMLLLRKGKSLLYQLHKPDAFMCQPVSSSERIHQAQKPVELMEQIISRFYHPETNPLLIDPFCGSGSTLVAARRVGIRQYFGYELDEVNRKRAVSFMVDEYIKDAKGDRESNVVQMEGFE